MKSAAKVSFAAQDGERRLVHFSWRSLASALLTVGLGMAMAAPAAAAGFDRAGFAGGLCGNAAATAAATETAMTALATAAADEIAFIDTTVDALVGRSLRCIGPQAAIASASGLADAVTTAPLAAPGPARTPILNLRSRAAVENLKAALTLLGASTSAARSDAIALLARRPNAVPPAVYARAAQTAGSPAERAAIEELTVLSALTAGAPAERLAAIAGLSKNPNRRSLQQLESLRADPSYAADAAFRGAVDAAVDHAAWWVKVSSLLSIVYNGVSYASILFIAALGLAIIFGLMGVINLAQGEFIMLGAYTTFIVQEAMQRLVPALVDWYLIVAIPFVFLVTAALGVLMEVAIVRHLYRRPLMTLLATWAVSLFLINLVRVGFGTQNLQFLTPFYVSGGVTLVGDFIVTYNRLFAIVFAVLVMALTWFLLKRTALGLNIRTVSQNRDMAGCIGIPTRRVDRTAFGLGAGLAGLAGLALAPIYNVNPLMGTNFIIESFMVVVLGGVGTLGGTLIASLGIGQINVLIEPLYGAVAAKVIVLLLIIAFIQWRPEGLFPAPGRRK